MVLLCFSACISGERGIKINGEKVCRAERAVFSEFLEILNKNRMESCDCPLIVRESYPLDWSPVLSRAAKIHLSRRIGAPNDGHAKKHSVFEIIKNQGYDFDFTVLFTAEGMKTGRELLNYWKKNPSRWAMLLNSGWTDIGGAVCEIPGKDNTVWAVILASEPDK